MEGGQIYLPSVWPLKVLAFLSHLLFVAATHAIEPQHFPSSSPTAASYFEENTKYRFPIHEACGR